MLKSFEKSYINILMSKVMTLTAKSVIYFSKYIAELPLGLYKLMTFS